MPKQDACDSIRVRPYSQAALGFQPERGAYSMSRMSCVGAADPRSAEDQTGHHIGKSETTTSVNSLQSGSSPQRSYRVGAPLMKNSRATLSEPVSNAD